MVKPNPSLKGLTNQLKDKLIQQALERRLKRAGALPDHDASFANFSPVETPSVRAIANLPESCYRFEHHPAYQQIRIMQEGAKQLGVPNPFFRVHDGVAADTTRIGGREYINYSSYNYLGMSGDPEVSAAAKAAIDQYGTSVSASRPVSGERALHRKFEKAIAEVYEVDDCIAMVSGHAANVTTLGYLFGPRDLILHDSLIHNSVLQGIQLSGAKRLPFPHNDLASLEEILRDQRLQYERVLIVIEGIYSMDGDYPDLPAIVAIKERYRCFLMVDEAHSFGIMGQRGLGIREHFQLPGNCVDIWMGTLSKALAGCGGYIAGSRALVEPLKYFAPGFLYSVGMPPPVAAAALAALNKMIREPERVQRLQEQGQRFLRLARAGGIDTGTSTGLAVIPAIIGSSLRAARLSNALFEQGINVQPILYPAVPEKSARLRFFLSCMHTDAQIEHTVQLLGKELLKA